MSAVAVGRDMGRVFYTPLHSIRQIPGGKHRMFRGRSTASTDCTPHSIEPTQRSSSIPENNVAVACWYLHYGIPAFRLPHQMFPKPSASFLTFLVLYMEIFFSGKEPDLVPLAFGSKQSAPTKFVFYPENLQSFFYKVDKPDEGQPTSSPVAKGIIRFLWKRGGREGTLAHFQSCR